MKEQTKRKINKVTIIIIFLTLATVIITSIATCGGGEKGTKVTWSEAYIISQHYVKARLVSPATADFPFACDYNQQNDTTFIIKSYVDSQNGFGAVIRTNYVTTLVYKGGKEGNWHDDNNWLELTFKTW